MEHSAKSAQGGKVWLITGAVVGLGRELAEYLLETGARVVATGRKLEPLRELATRYPATLLVTPMDVTDPQQVEAAVTATVKRFGRIDVLVNNAGYGMARGVDGAVSIGIY